MSWQVKCLPPHGITREIQLVLQRRPSSGCSEISYSRKLTTVSNVLSWTAIPKAMPLTTVKSGPQSVFMCCYYVDLQLIHLPRTHFSFLPMAVFTIIVLMHGNTECIFLKGYSTDT